MSLMRAIAALFSLIYILFFASGAYAKSEEELFWLLVDRRIDEERVLSEFEAHVGNDFEINKRFSSGPTTRDSFLRVAAYRGFTQVTKFLLSHGADPNLVLEEKICSPLGTALMGGHEDVAFLLLKNSADTGLPICWPAGGRNIGDSVIMYDLSLQMTEIIMRRHAELGYDLSPAILHRAIATDNFEIAALYLDLTPNYRNEKSLTLAKSRSERIYNLLLSSWPELRLGPFNQ
ncbi:ankyrin repeat domain-containing protein [Marinobacter sp.]|uniref:ankyrin repeat domain-containing protein n=1 Tax=Marinobacter sp. TaxID=50741 RepID=UPI003A8F0B0A